jgi:hypothetical protein
MRFYLTFILLLFTYLRKAAESSKSKRKSGFQKNG